MFFWNSQEGKRNSRDLEIFFFLLNYRIQLGVSNIQKGFELNKVFAFFFRTKKNVE